MQLQEDIYTSGGVQTHTLWASLRTTQQADKRVNQQRNTLIVFKKYNLKKITKSGDQNPL